MADPAALTSASAPVVAIAEPFEQAIENVQMTEGEDQAPGPRPSILQGDRDSERFGQPILNRA